ncbi:MAG: hypothetical protein OEM97_00040 [Acidimicrobiia bacterium]|nr:hypothetical protein [Acidimicrobiia bacterium]
MNRPIAVASVVGGIILAIGMLLLPFSAAQPTLPASIEATEDGDATACGSLLSHYTSGPEHDGCNTVATDRTYMVVAGVVVAVLGGWSLVHAR